jgi:hypothetical protein
MKQDNLAGPFAGSLIAVKIFVSWDEEASMNRKKLYRALSLGSLMIVAAACHGMAEEPQGLFTAPNADIELHLAALLGERVPTTFD